MSRASLRNQLVSACKYLRLSRHRPFRFYSSESDPVKQDSDGSADVEDVSNEELRRRVERFMAGDDEAIPSIFEAILSRKLAGKHEDSDSELMEEIKTKTSAIQDDDFDYQRLRSLSDDEGRVDNK